MVVELVTMSSKGQVVIPKKLRAAIKAGEGTTFAVTTTKDTVVLRKIKEPSIEWTLAETSRILAPAFARIGVTTEEEVIRRAVAARKK
jgi:AbrB family looped-hinge helix DNA binding protein